MRPNLSAGSEPASFTESDWHTSIMVEVALEEPIEKTDSEQESIEQSFPDGGFRAWATVFGVRCC
jgi:hypothetical protein